MCGPKLSITAQGKSFSDFNVQGFLLNADSESVGQEWALILCTSDKLPGSVEIAQ